MQDAGKKTTADVQSTPMTQGRKVATVTWFKVHEALMNPGMDHLTSYQIGNINMHGNKKFRWVVGADYVLCDMPTGETCVIPLVNFVSFTVKFGE